MSKLDKYYHSITDRLLQKQMKDKKVLVNIITYLEYLSSQGNETAKRLLKEMENC